VPDEGMVADVQDARLVCVPSICGEHNR
jgi:hypothetical protein